MLSFSATEDLRWRFTQMKQHLTDMIVNVGLGGALNWYKPILSGLAAEDDKGEIPADSLLEFSLTQT